RSRHSSRESRSVGQVEIITPLSPQVTVCGTSCSPDRKGSTMTRENGLELAHKFLSVLSTPDENVVRSVVADEMVWSFPGSSVISGEAQGVGGVKARGKVNAADNVDGEIRRAVYGYNGVAIILHNHQPESPCVLG